MNESSSSLDFLSAFQLVRKHRVDMNFLYDHNPSQFIEHIKLFVHQLKEDPDALNLFLSGLKNKDSIKATMYKGHLELLAKTSPNPSQASR
jgi:elongator complex protein 1